MTHAASRVLSSSEVGKAITLLLLALAWTASGCAFPPALPQERIALEIPAGVDDWWFTVSPGGHGAAYIERQGTNAFLMCGGRRLGPFP